MSVRPVGNLPASVYWRRRALVSVPVLFLVGITCWVACDPGGSSPQADASSPIASTSSVASTPSSSPTASPSLSPTPTASGSSPATTSAAPATSAAAALAACSGKSLAVAAVTSAKSFTVGSQPVLSLQVTNIGKTPCTQDLADEQVVLTVTSGSARVWGSHDCKVEPGTDVSTLEPGRPVRLSITWTGLSSQPGCAAKRQQAPAGTYTLQASLAGIAGKPATFTLA